MRIINYNTCILSVQADDSTQAEAHGEDYNDCLIEARIMMHIRCRRVEKFLDIQPTSAYAH